MNNAGLRHWEKQYDKNPLEYCDDMFGWGADGGCLCLIVFR